MGMLTCCDADCAGANHCEVGGIRCTECGKYFCAYNIDEFHGRDVCIDCYENLHAEEEAEAEELDKE